jgi:signal transduction histidine kinase
LQLIAESAGVSEHIKDEILENISQEFYDPLTNLQKQIQVLLELKKGTLNDEQCSSLQFMKAELDYLLDVVETVSDLQQIDYSNQKAVIDLNELATQSIDHFQRIADRTGVTLSAELTSNPVQVHGNASHIVRVMESFLSNAIKYCQKGGKITIDVKIIKENTKTWSLVKVQDNGRGIDLKGINRVFDASFQGDAKDKLGSGGLGIGLSLAKEIVLAHSGKVWVESELGKGSTFYFALPSIKM